MSWIIAQVIFSELTNPWMRCQNHWSDFYASFTVGTTRRSCPERMVALWMRSPDVSCSIISAPFTTANRIKHGQNKSLPYELLNTCCMPWKLLTNKQCSKALSQPKSVARHAPCSSKTCCKSFSKALSQSHHANSGTWVGDFSLQHGCISCPLYNSLLNTTVVNTVLLMHWRNVTFMT